MREYNIRTSPLIFKVSEKKINFSFFNPYFEIREREDQLILTVKNKK
jgi:hypothetical protein